MFGGLIGATLGLLLAPQSGEKTRTSLQHKSHELRDKVTRTAQDAQTRVETFAEETLAKAEALQQRGLDFVNENKERIENMAEAVKTAAQDTWAESGAKTRTESGSPY